MCQIIVVLPLCVCVSVSVYNVCGVHIILAKKKKNQQNAELMFKICQRANHLNLCCLGDLCVCVELNRTRTGKVYFFFAM